MENLLIIVDPGGRDDFLGVYAPPQSRKLGTYIREVSIP